MSLKKKRSCSQLEHHEGALHIGNSDEKPPMKNGDIVLTNVVSKNPFTFAWLHAVILIGFDGGLGGQRVDDLRSAVPVLSLKLKAAI